MKKILFICHGRTVDTVISAMKCDKVGQIVVE